MYFYSMWSTSMLNCGQFTDQQHSVTPLDTALKEFVIKSVNWNFNINIHLKVLSLVNRSHWMHVLVCLIVCAFNFWFCDWRTIWFSSVFQKLPGLTFCSHCQKCRLLSQLNTTSVNVNGTVKSEYRFLHTFSLRNHLCGHPKDEWEPTQTPLYCRFTFIY